MPFHHSETAGRDGQTTGVKEGGRYGVVARNSLEEQTRRKESWSPNILRDILAVSSPEKDQDVSLCKA